MASWDEGEPNTFKSGALWNTFKLPGHLSHLGEPLYWQDCKMGWRTQQKLWLTGTQSIWTKRECPASSAHKWQNCSPSNGSPSPAALDVWQAVPSPTHTQCALISFADLSCLETMSLTTSQWRNTLFRRKMDPNQSRWAFLAICWRQVVRMTRLRGSVCGAPTTRPRPPRCPSLGCAVASFYNLMYQQICSQVTCPMRQGWL